MFPFPLPVSPSVFVSAYPPAFCPPLCLYLSVPLCSSLYLLYRLCLSLSLSPCLRPSPSLSASSLPTLAGRKASGTRREDERETRSLESSSHPRCFRSACSYLICPALPVLCPPNTPFQPSLYVRTALLTPTDLTHPNFSFVPSPVSILPGTTKGVKGSLKSHSEKRYVDICFLMLSRIRYWNFLQNLFN